MLKSNNYDLNEIFHCIDSCFESTVSFNVAAKTASNPIELVKNHVQWRIRVKIHSILSNNFLNSKFDE